MKYVSVGQFKAQFSSLLEGVVKGQSVGVCYGRRKKPVAVLSPVAKKPATASRPLGLWKGQMRFRYVGDGKLTNADLLAS